MLSRRQILSMLLATPTFGFSGAPDDNMSDGIMDSFRFPDEPHGNTVYKTGFGPPVLLLHEIDGMTPETLQLADRLVKRGFTVYLPLLFGKKGEDKAYRVILRTPCWGGEFYCTSPDAIGKITGWIGRLTLKIHADTGKKLGVIGNCLTGSVPLVLLADRQTAEKIACAVLSQPAIPLGFFPFAKPVLKRHQKALAVSRTQIEAAVHNVTERRIPLLAFHFNDDPVVPTVRMEELASLFPKELMDYEPLKSGMDCKMRPGKPPTFDHAVLTSGYCEDPDSSGLQAFNKLVAFLTANLIVARSQVSSAR